MAFKPLRVLVVQYDTEYDPETCWHIEVQWVAAAGHNVGSWVDAMRRKFRNSPYFNMIQIPTAQPSKTADAFHPPILLQLPVPALNRIAQRYLMHHDFWLDSSRTGWRKQYLHHTGMALVRVVSEGLLWLSNHLNSNADHRYGSCFRFALGSDALHANC